MWIYRGLIKIANCCQNNTLADLNQGFKDQETVKIFYTYAIARFSQKQEYGALTILPRLSMARFRT